VTGPILTTPRMRLRPLTRGDVPAFHRQWNLAEVGRFLWDGKPVAEATVQEVIAASESSFAGAGYGLFAASTAETAEGASPVGFCGLRPAEGQRDPEILYAFDPAFWGRGYALESARAVLEFAFTSLGLPRVTAGANPANPASWRVLERAGLRRTGLVHTAIEDLYTYEAVRDPVAPDPPAKDPE